MGKPEAVIIWRRILPRKCVSEKVRRRDSVKLLKGEVERYEQ